MGIFTITDPCWMDRLFTFRYRIYVEEMGRKQKYADHARRLIQDPLDATAHNVVALDGQGQIAGCVRLNLCRDGGTDYYESLTRMEDVGSDHPYHTSLCTRLMVAPEFRKSPLAARLACACYDIAMAQGVVWNFVDCNEHLVPFFRRLGYRFTHRAFHEEYGDVIVMRLNLQDIDGLHAMQSLFVVRHHGRGIPPLLTVQAFQSSRCLSVPV